MKQTLRNLFKNETFVSALLIFLTTVITYGISIPKLGYYYDDWYVLWSGQSRGAASMIPLFSTDRPFIGVIYSYVYRLFGDTIVSWHLYALLWRFIGGLAFFWILRLIWPQHKYVTTLMVILFIVYPGFLSQPDANTKQNHLYGFGTALLSIALMLQMLKTNNRTWKIICSLLSIILTANYLFIYEYMIGFEGTRLILLGFVLFQLGITEFRPLVRETLKRVWPYWVVTAGFLYWRLFIFEGARNATNAARLAGSYLSDLRHMSFQVIIGTIQDFLSTSIFAWFVHPYQLISSSTYTDLTAAVLIAVLVVVLVLIYSVLFKKLWGVDYLEPETHHLMREFMWIGALVIIFAVAPVIVSGRSVDLSDAYKSYGLHPISGVVLFVFGIVLMLQPKFRKLTLIALIAVSVTTQVLNADYWAQLWNYETTTWWQLTWRAPDIQNNTLVMAYLPSGYRLQQDYEIWGPINLIYRREPATAPVIQSEILNSDTAYNVLRKSILNNHDRDIKMHRDFGNLLLISLPAPNSCIHVIDGMLPVYSESEALLVQQVGGYSHLDRIIPTGKAPIPPVSIFGLEPPHDWCYFYQKASLARQVGDWKEIGKLYDQTLKLKLEPNDTSEIIPFFEGLVNLGRYDKASALYNNVIKGHVKLRFPVCTTLSHDPGYPPEFGYNYKMIYTLLCNS